MLRTIWFNTTIFVIATVVAVAIVLTAARYLIRRHRHRVHQHQPRVRLKHDGIIYDLSDTLIRAADKENGCPQWIIIGPLHLRFGFGSMNELLCEDLPSCASLHTGVLSHGEGIFRFMTKEELHTRYRGILE